MAANEVYPTDTYYQKQNDVNNFSLILCLFWLSHYLLVLLFYRYTIESEFNFVLNFVWQFYNMYFLNKQGSKEIEERSPEKEKRKAKVRGDERKERKMSRKRVSSYISLVFYINF